MESQLLLVECQGQVLRNKIMFIMYPHLHVVRLITLQKKTQRKMLSQCTRVFQLQSKISAFQAGMCLACVLIYGEVLCLKCQMVEEKNMCV